MATRAERRREERIIDKLPRAFNPWSEEELKQAVPNELVKNAYDRGMYEGFRQATLEMVERLYGAVVIGLKDEFDMNDEDCLKAIQAIDNKIRYCIENEEVAEEALEKAGIRVKMLDVMHGVDSI